MNKMFNLYSQGFIIRIQGFFYAVHTETKKI